MQSTFPQCLEYQTVYTIMKQLRSVNSPSADNHVKPLKARDLELGAPRIRIHGNHCQLERANVTSLLSHRLFERASVTSLLSHPIVETLKSKCYFALLA